MPLNDRPTEITVADIDKFVKDMNDGVYDLKLKPCFKCGKDHFPNYGVALTECDECWFSRFPKDQVKAFYRSLIE